MAWCHSQSGGSIYTFFVQSQAQNTTSLQLRFAITAPARLQRMHVCLWPDWFWEDFLHARLSDRISELASSGCCGQLVGSKPWSVHHGEDDLPRDNPGVYTRTFNELFKVAKERSAWKIELKGVLASAEINGHYISYIWYIPPWSYFPSMVHWHRVDRSSPSPPGMCGDLQRGNQWLVGRGQMCDSRNLGNPTPGKTSKS